MTSTIFAIGPDNKLTELQASQYESEALLQQLLADHPSLLNLGGGGDGKLLLIRRELAVPDAEDGSGRWSLDHLYIDRAGVPVLVEVKRASDTRARREVVAQMLDYAANGVAYWPIDTIVAGFRATAEASGEDPDTVLDRFLESGSGEDFWKQVEANLRSGRIRMVFVADRIAKELRRIIEFLNEQMRPAEVLAIEVEQYLGANGLRTLVPRLVGATERAASTKAVAPRAALSMAEWMEALEASAGKAAREAAESIVAWFDEAGFYTGVTESTDSVFAAVPLDNGRNAWPFFLRRSSGKLEVALGYLKSTPAFGPEEERRRLLDRLLALPVPFASTMKLNGWPNMALSAWEDEAQRVQLQAIFRDVQAALTSG